MATEMKVKLSNLKVDNTIDGNVLNDSNGNNIVETYFPKTGGMFTGNTIKRDINNGDLFLVGGTDTNNGASLRILGKDYSSIAGHFVITATDGDNKVDLVGSPHGILNWNNMDLGGATIVAKSLGTNGYIKYANGLIIQWGNTSNVANVTYFDRTTQISFEKLLCGFATRYTDATQIYTYATVYPLSNQKIRITLSRSIPAIEAYYWVIICK